MVNPLKLFVCEMLIDCVPTVARFSLVEAPGFIKVPGGVPANIACTHFKSDSSPSQKCLTAGALGNLGLDATQQLQGRL